MAFAVLLSMSSIPSTVEWDNQSFYVRCKRQYILHNVWLLRIWWPKINSYKDLWKVTRQEDINVDIRKRKFRWIGHTLRKEAGEIPKSALFWNPQGNRKRGRPRNSWRRSVKKEAGRSWNELSFLAADRRKWKGLIDNLCSWKRKMDSIIILMFDLFHSLMLTSTLTMPSTYQIMATQPLGLRSATKK